MKEPISDQCRLECLEALLADFDLPFESLWKSQGQQAASVAALRSEHPSQHPQSRPEQVVSS